MSVSKREEALQLRAAGLSVRAIADELQLTETAVRRYLGERGERVPEGWGNALEHKEEIIKAYCDAEPIASIAARFETTPYCVQKLLIEEEEIVNSSEARRAFREEKRRTRDELVVKEYLAGKRIVDIAAQVGIGQAQIYVVLARRGLRPMRREVV